MHIRWIAFLAFAATLLGVTPAEAEPGAEPELGPWFYRFVDAQLRKIEGAERDGLVVALPDGGQLQLHRTAHNCTLVPKGECKAMVRRFLRAVGTLDVTAAEDDVSWAAAAPRLRVRLYDLHGHPEGRSLFEDAAHAETLPELLSVVMLDSPETTRSVSASELSDWGVSTEQALERARKNHSKDPRPVIERLGPPEVDLPALVVGSDDHYLSSYLIWLDTLLADEPTPAYGWAVVARSRDMIWLFRMDQLEHLVTGVDLVSRLLFGDEVLNPFSPTGFWLHDGVLERLDLRLDAESLRFAPSARMTELLTESD